MTTLPEPITGGSWHAWLRHELAEEGMPDEDLDRGVIIVLSDLVEYLCRRLALLQGKGQPPLH